MVGNKETLGLIAKNTKKLDEFLASAKKTKAAMERVEYLLNTGLSKQKINCPRCQDQGINIQLFPSDRGPHRMNCRGCDFEVTFDITNLGKVKE